LRLEATIPILPTLKARAEFLAVRGGRRASTPAFLIEMRERPEISNKTEKQTPKRATGPRFGFTITKKLGNAVARNRIRRRLKAAFAAARDQHATAPCDYVIVARHAALDRPFTLLLEDVARSLSTLHRSGGPARTGDRRAPSQPPSPQAGGKKGSA
jgi:ribonuclease P protein component